MTPAARTDPGKATVAFGPEAPGWGSWDWVGADLLRALDGPFRTRAFAAWEEPDCDAVVVVKHAPPPDWVACVARRAAVLYAPVDAYGSAAAIDADATWLRRCGRVVVHCERLRKSFEPYAAVEYLDHHVKFAAPLRAAFRAQGDLLWVGVRSNIPPVARWVNDHPPPAPLDVLTNLEDPSRTPDPAELGFRPGLPVRVHPWSPARHVALTAAARGAFDVKGDDFRSRHKPPAKAIDFLASGVPLALDPRGSAAEHLARLGFEVASTLDTGRWLSRAYWEETRNFGGALRELLATERVARRLGRILRDALAERNGLGPNP